MEKNMIKFSIIIPVYNCEKYLDRCIDSIINQEYKNLEIIFVNDGSTDNSLKILKEFAKKDKRIIIINQKNQGALIARNKGIDIATGDYISFVDSDDWISKNMYEKLYFYIVKYNSPDIIRFDYFTNSLNNKSEKLFLDREYPVLFDSKNRIEIYDMLVSSYNLNRLWQGIYKRELFINNLVYEKVTAGNDYYQMLLLIDKTNNILFTNEYLYYYCINHNSITKTHNVNRIGDNIKSVFYVNNNVLEFLKKWNVYSKKYVINIAVSSITYFMHNLSKIKDKEDFNNLCNICYNDNNFNNLMSCIDKSDIVEKNLLKQILKRAIYSKNKFILNLYRLKNRR